MGCMFPQAQDLAQYWSLIRDRIDAITEVPETHWRVADYHDADPRAADRTYARRGGFLTPVDFPLLDFGIAPHSLEATDTTQLLGLLVARAALEDAGYPETRSFDRDRVSVILGVSGTLELVIPLGARLGQPIWRRALLAAGVDGSTTEDVVRRIASSYVGWQEGSFPGLLGNVAAGRIANRLDLGGTNCVVDAACASSLGALELALLELATGRCDLAVTGGIDTFNDIFVYMCFSKTPALSPTGDARPFDADADGTILGEGLGLLVLKRLDDARRDGDRIYAVIKSIGSSSDGKGQAVYAPSAAGQVKALRRAIDLADIAPESVELIEAHGTGTKVGDATELAALDEVYGKEPHTTPWCALGSVKSQVGHTKAAAGAAGLIKTAMALHHKVLPPTSKVRRPIERLAGGHAPFYLNTEARPWLPTTGQPRRAAVSAFGFGGSNFHCILEEAGPEKASVDWDGDVQILALSAQEPSQIHDMLEPWESRTDWSEFRREAALSRSLFRADHHVRMLLAVERGKNDPATVCAAARARLESSSVTGSAPSAPISLPGAGTGDQPRVFLGIGRPTGKLAMLFPGQGSQYVGMLRDLACRFPVMQRSLGLSNEIAGGTNGLLSDRIYPRTAFGDDARQAHELALRETSIAQPAIGAVCLGLIQTLENFGVRPDFAAGHSFGELTALRAAGWIDDRSFLHLAHQRGALMARRTPGEDPGAMLAVFGSLEEVQSVLSAHRIDVIIANKNAPRQHVLSGTTAEIARAEEIFRACKISTHSIAVSAAFHSKLVASAEPPLRHALESIRFSPTTIPVFGNTTASPYPANPAQARALLAGQLARPVEFVAQIEAMHRMGARTFLEVGPDAKLTALVRTILHGQEFFALPVDASRSLSGNIFDLACSIAALAALGYAVDLERWDEGCHGVARNANRTGLTAKIGGANVRPKAATFDQPRNDSVPSRIMDQKTVDEPASTTASPESLFADDSSPAGTAQSRPRERIGIETKMNPPEGTRPHHHTNGQAGSHESPLGSTNARRGTNDPALSSTAPNSAPPGVPEALTNARASLMALERLAQQTAELHRQFLEGQEKTQQSFLKLLEHEQRLSTLSFDPPEPQASANASTADRSPRDSRAVIESVVPTVQTPVGQDVHAQPVTIATNLDLGRAVAEFNGHAPPAKSQAAGSLARILIDVVSDKTGYPAEVLDLDMQLDSDLGIDSIKRVEILSALQDRLPGIPALDPELLGSFRTLRSIADHIGDAKSDAGPANGEERSGCADDLRIPAGEIERILLETVAEKTGYPIDILEMGMRLDTDLGIDSIKRVEIFSALQDRLPAAPAAAPDQIGTLVTLGEIVDFLRGTASFDVRREAASARVSPPTDSNSASMANGSPPTVDQNTRFSAPTLERDVSRNIDPVFAAKLSTLTPRGRSLGELDRREKVTLRPGGIVWVTADGSRLAEAVRSQVIGRGYSCRVVALEESFAPGSSDSLCGLIILAPTNLKDEAFIGKAFRLLRSSAAALEISAARGGSAFVTVARLDGAFGVGGLACETSPSSGALAGMTKTAGREWPAVHCKAIDLEPRFEPVEKAAESIVTEMLTRGPSEVGLGRAGRTTIELEPILSPGMNGRHTTPLDRGDLVVISGGGRGITADVAVALAESCQPRLVLLGRAAEPVEEPGWLAALHDEADLKRGLLERSARRRTPQELGEEARRVLAQREIRRNLARITAAGSPVVYRSVDVRDAETVRATLLRIRQEFGPVRGLVHGAGVLADRRIVEQTDAQFALVYETKVKGIHHLFESIEPGSLKFLVVFSSSTARFGRVGQVAYAAANEYLNKWAQLQSARLPSCRVVSFNWGPWAGGMVTDALRTLFEKEGVGLIAPRDGGKLVADLAAGSESRAVEVVVLAEAKPALNSSSASPAKSLPPSRDENLATVFRRSVDCESLPVLTAHVIDSHAVLPVAMILEWMAEGAVHRNPGLAVCGVDEFRLFKGVILSDGRGATVDLCAGKAVRRGDQFVVPVELRGTLANGRDVAHARASIVLGEERGADARRIVDAPLSTYPRARTAIYQAVLFHGPAMQAIESVEGCGERAIAGWVSTAPQPSEWIDQPVRATWLIDPLAVDGAFQLVGLWTRERLGYNSLPTALGTLRQFRREYPAGAVRVVVAIRDSSGSRAVADIEILDERGRLVARLDGFECVVDSSLNQAFRRNRLPSVVSVVTS
jgi:acyl transferase domain-containing protein/NAD(P)-dependent dehydrogenase (short-subunit alcohol dehydrogenase family)/acyl carrier protein